MPKPKGKLPSEPTKAIVKRPVGAPAIPPDEREAIVSHILHEIANSEHGLQRVCQDDGRIAAYTFHRWLQEDESLRQRYAQAQDDRAEHMGAKLLSIADDGENDTYVDEEGRTRVDHDVIARSKLRVDTRKWLMAHLAPKKWGDRPPAAEGEGVVVPIQINIG